MPSLRGQINVAKIKTSLEGAQVWSRDLGWTAHKELKLLMYLRGKCLNPFRRLLTKSRTRLANSPVLQQLLDLHHGPCHRLSDLSNATRPHAYLLLVEKKSID
ncbi:hypothetical protein BKA82DRAFT_383752 [Pisolithus tinctorius]|uniref:Uncharacterized protein n=1 Tax=Pisolithus tinctorius Marx 270 TaxID=870435 RepID=A0A0C3NG38_PISTI|nr:hypothetical protein BKA82DRAFT_383752 [Pisolithus tinctorius]KIN94423.1 hypothetical protein M404DRAFT_383752 [Pisolithus tinctorius Marx 270]